jgi:hypothetical protein
MKFRFLMTFQFDNMYMRVGEFYQALSMTATHAFFDLKNGATAFIPLELLAAEDEPKKEIPLGLIMNDIIVNFKEGVENKIPITFFREKK